MCNAFSDLYLKTPANQKSHFKNPGFTLTEILLAIAIVGLIAALVLPAMVTNYQNRALELGFNRELNALNETVRGLAVTENKLDFFSTIMYSDSEPEGYDETSGKFVKKYLKVSKYCGDNNGDCFAEKYYNYNDSTHKKEVYEPLYKGACASLKNGASICITPQVGGTQIAGFLDINGKKGPNILNRDLRPFTIDINTEKTSLSKTTTEVLSTPETDLKLGGACEENSLSKECCDTRPVAKGDPCCIHYQSKVGHPCYEAPEPPKSACELDPNGLDCCRTKTSSITDNSHACCNYSEIAKSVNICRKVNINFHCEEQSLGLAKRYTCHFKQSGYNDGAHYGIFTIFGKGVNCEYNGSKVDCNDLNVYIGVRKRFFDKNNSDAIILTGAISRCQVIKNNTVLQAYNWSECVKGIEYTYISDN